MSAEHFDIKTWQTNYSSGMKPQSRLKGKFAKKGLSNKSKPFKYFNNVNYDLQKTGARAFLL